jgi:diguanylate cyclase (GGDEF)-like protein
MHIQRFKLAAPVAALILTIAAIAAIWLLVARNDSSRDSQLQVSSLTLSLADLQSAPFNADPAAGGSAKAIRARIRADEASISGGLTADSRTGVPLGLLIAGRSDLASIKPIVASVYRLAVQPGGLAGAGSRVAGPQARLTVRSAGLSVVLKEIARADAARADSARQQTKFGAAGAMLLLLLAFAYFYFRSVAAREAVERLAGENETLLDASRDEARTDTLTELGNRRALSRDLAAATADPPESGELLLAMLDLDGFKQYNDTFGHSAGDALLQRLGGRLSAVAKQHSGSAYRMGGDEFCMLARCRPDAAEQLLDDTIAALQDSGDGWHVGCSQGAAWMPSEAASENEALNLADERMYANKAGRSSASRQVTDALLQVITEQNAHLDEHVELTGECSGALAETLGLPEREVRRIRLAAKLHDVGKTAIPASILDKPGPLDDQEWTFMRRHPQIGERIVLAAPALANTAALIRSSHERVDGQGYPDGLVGQNIPMGSRIIAVCDAYDAMTSNRVYRPGIGSDAALDELKRNAGTQFDTTVVEAFCKLKPRQHSEPRTAPQHRQPISGTKDPPGTTDPPTSSRRG